MTYKEEEGKMGGVVMAGKAHITRRAQHSEIPNEKPALISPWTKLAGVQNSGVRVAQNCVDSSPSSTI